ncbi:hypothetical protein RchiOBHm_Chr3g0455411 [Rosa chinensis]|uniref:Uncharacterized protein n=1 Tax=Rosa chinensis TaxID=74649 RepID=A0A2P6R721_ROSCH|nr:hypothetical protein RchiOBHm_Chr3g0455411 [Rosa chinensis]
MPETSAQINPLRPPPSPGNGQIRPSSSTSVPNTLASASAPAKTRLALSLPGTKMLRHFHLGRLCHHFHVIGSGHFICLVPLPSLRSEI